MVACGHVLPGYDPGKLLATVEMAVVAADAEEYPEGDDQAIRDWKALKLAATTAAYVRSVREIVRGGVEKEHLQHQDAIMAEIAAYVRRNLQ